MSLVIVGSVAFDTIRTPWGDREKIVGGSGTYCSLAASYFTRPRIVGVVGRDFPRKTLALLRARGVDLEGLKIKAGKTFHWEGRYAEDPNKRTTLRTELNVFADFRPAIPRRYRNSAIVYLANLNPEHHGFILEQFRKPALVAMDTIRLWIETKREALLRELGRVNVFFANDEEARLITGEANLVAAGRALVRLGPSLIVLKKGEHGALVFGREFVFGVLAHPCEHVIDPTGAGDSFAGGFLGYLDRAEGLSPREVRRAAVYGSVLASFVIEDFGIGRFLTLEPELVEARFRQFRRMTSF
ncbi:MAG TPA: PfkB family carbohydrate kinase [Acidobacteriota bacterium]|nr:PfkB family carbohydrate kinase [Acidobacteriota bacterium]